MGIELRPKVLGNRMMELAGSSWRTADERLEDLRRTADLAQKFISEEQTDYFEKPVGSLWLRMVLGCMPSLMMATTGGSHTAEVAESVCEGLNQQVGEIMDHQVDNFARSHKRQGAINGYVSELTVLSVLWWGIAHDEKKTTWCVWPSLSYENGGPREHRGFKTGYDLLLRNPGQPKTPIQVKTRQTIDSEHSDKRIVKTYIPGMAVVGSQDLINAKKNHAALLLMEALVTNDEKTLRYANMILDYELHQARLRAERYADRKSK